MAADHDPGKAPSNWLSVTGHQLDIDPVLSDKGESNFVRL